jgi:hypothetical protein
VREKLISPLGNPANNKKKYFSLIEIEALGRDPVRLAAATDSIYARNAEKSQYSCSQAPTTRLEGQRYVIQIQ